MGTIIDDNGVFSITERYPKTFDLYKGLSGSIYKLSSDGFLSNQTTWSLEIVNSNKVLVLEELPIIDTYNFLKQLETAGCLKLYHYPNKPSWSPLEDSDIIKKAVIWTREISSDVGIEFLQLHPHLKDQFETALKAFDLSK